MKIQRKITPTTIVEVEGQTPVEVFERLAHMEEVFSGHETCGACKSTGVRYSCRQDKEGHKYFQVTCLACCAEFRFGQKKGPGGLLFPQLKDKDGNWKPNGGWAKWQAQQQQSQPNYDNQDADRPPDF